MQKGHIHKKKSNISTCQPGSWILEASLPVYYIISFLQDFSFERRRKTKKKTKEFLFMSFCSSGPPATERRFSQKEMDVEEEDNINQRPISTSYFSGSQHVLLLHLAPKKRMSVFLKILSHLLSAICCRVWSEVLFSFFFLWSVFVFLGERY